MSITISHPETGDPVEVFVRLIESEVGCDYIEAMCRAETREAWDAAALANNLLRQDVIGTDEDDEPILSDPYPTYGVNIEHIGPVVITPATYDEEGEELTPAVLDTRHHVNFRISADLAWQPIALAWMTMGAPDEPNKSEEAKVLAGVSLINPDSVNSPSRTWF